MRKDDFLRSVASWAPGDHLCCLYEGEVEHQALITPLLRLGLERGEKVLCLVDSRTASMVPGYLRDEGLEIEPYLESGQLTTLIAEEAYNRNGHFDPDEWVAFLRTETERALAEGYTALRVSGEMAWVLGERSGSERLIEYESKLNTFIPGSKCLVVCQYDRHRFEAALLLEVVVAHPIVVAGADIRQNLYYIPPVQLLGQNRALSALDHWLEQLAAHERAQEALRQKTLFLQLLQDVAIAANQADSAEEVIQFALDQVCTQMSWPVGHAYLLRADVAGKLESTNIWHLVDTERFETFRRKSEAIDFAAGDGLPGRAFVAGVPVVMTDVTNASDFVRGELAEDVGIRTGIAVPVLAGEEAVAVLEFFTESAETPAQSLLELMTHIGNQLGLAIERKRTEETLRRSQSQLADAQHMAHIGSWEWEIGSDRVSWSDELYRIFGLSPQERSLSYQDFVDRIHPDDRESVMSTIQRARENRQAFSFEHRIIRPDGSVKVVLGQGKVVPEGVGRPLRLVGTSQDVTEIKRSEQALDRSEARFRTIFERAAIGISLVDAEGRIITSNPSLQQMLGYTAEELRGMPFSEFTHPADVKSNASLFQDMMAGKLDYYRIEKRYVHKDGHVVWGHLTASAVQDAEGKAQFGIGMVKDITERKRMEAELAELQHRLIEGREAERLYLAQELHDGPLQVLIGATYQLGELGDALPDEQSLGQVVAAQASLQQVIRMLRTVARELRPPALAPFGLAKAMRSHAEDFRQEHPELDVQLDLASDDQTLPEQMRLALFRIYQQALRNVVRHARAGRVQIRFAFDRGLVTLEIQDDGRGFTMPRRWIELARQGHLGLVGMSERAEAIGGWLEIRSAPGEGTLIRVVAPYSETEE
jgi:PAS domain S-box-containing protein